MIKIDQCATIDAILQVELDSINLNERSAAWDGKREPVKQFKKLIMDHGLVAQKSRCVWCTLMIGVEARRTIHRDHIAPKSSYPQWTFHAKNLALTCECCNGFLIKGKLDTVAAVGHGYDTTEFHIVHPYLDSTEDHITFLEEVEGESVTVQGISTKGLWTIEKMQLDSPGMTMERAKDLVFNRAIKNLPNHFVDLLKQATLRA